MADYLWVCLGAVLGASARLFVSRLSARFISEVLPYGTLIINVTGSFVLGFFLVWTTERVLADPRWRLFVAIGFCGSYTTFSSYAFETFAFFEQANWALVISNVMANNVVGFAAVIAGAMLARWL